MNPETIRKLENKEMKIYRILMAELEGGAKRIDYAKIAKELSCARSTVTYNIGKLLSAGVIGSENGKLYLRSG